MQNASNFKRKYALLLLFIIPLLLSSCKNEQSGTAIGAGVGGLLGSRFGKTSESKLLYTGIGAVLGGTLGNAIGKKLDEVDRQAARETQFNTLEYSRADIGNTWSNPKTGNKGTVVAGKRYEERGKICRDYRHTIYIEGKPETLKGVACRNSDGTWSALN